MTNPCTLSGTSMAIGRACPECGHHPLCHTMHDSYVNECQICLLVNLISSMQHYEKYLQHLQKQMDIQLKDGARILSAAERLIT